jgi:protein SCO1/2
MSMNAMTRMLLSAMSCLLLGLGAFVPAAHAQDFKAIKEKVGFDQKLDNQVPLDLVFKDESGASVRLEEYLKKGGNKPAVLVFVYFQCPMLCTEILNGLTRTRKVVGLTPGKDFEILTVSFDEREGPDLAARKKASYIESLGNPAAAKGWHFLTGTKASIDKLCDSAGFRFLWDEQIQQFAHPGGMVILTPEGRISKYYFDFTPRDLRFALVEASHGKIGSLSDKFLLLCYHYDPTTGRYGLVVTNVIRLLCLISVIVLGSFVFIMLRRDARRATHVPATT